MNLRLFVVFGLSISLLRAFESANGSQMFENILKNQNDPLVLTSNGDIESILEALLKDHVTMKTKFKKIDEEHRVLKNDILNLRRQNEHLEKQVSKLQNITDQKSQSTKCNCMKPRSMAPAEEEVSDFKASHTAVAPSALGSVPSGLFGRNAPLKDEPVVRKQKEKRLLLPNTAAPTTLVPSYARVAFHARLSANIINLGDNQHIDFKRVITNAGNAYNSMLGTFVCPVSGTYVFFLTMLVAPDKYLETEIVRNGNNIAYNYNFNDNHYSSASNMVIIDLQKNDDVWVRVYGSKHHSGVLANPDWSTFSGFLLWPNE